MSQNACLLFYDAGDLNIRYDSTTLAAPTFFHAITANGNQATARQNTQSLDFQSTKNISENKLKVMSFEWQARQRQRKTESKPKIGCRGGPKTEPDMRSAKWAHILNQKVVPTTAKRTVRFEVVGSTLRSNFQARLVDHETGGHQHHGDRVNPDSKVAFKLS